MSQEKNDIKTGNIGSATELLEYLEYCAQTHNYYKHYSKSEYIKSSIQKKAIFLSNGENWNDNKDKDNLFTDDKYTLFAYSISFSKSENVAMWMLYSGNDGCLFQFPRKIIQQILDVETLELGRFENEEFISRDEIGRDSFNIVLTDIIYYGECKEDANRRDAYYVKRSDEVNQVFDKKYVDELTYQKKKVSWSYENECRLVVKVKKEKCSSDDTFVKIKLNDEAVEELESQIIDSPNCEKTEYKKSKLSEDLNWNLCMNCTHKRSEEENNGSI